MIWIKAYLERPLGVIRERVELAASPKLAIVATIEVAPERRDQLLPLLMAHRGRCLKDEPGTLQFEVLVLVAVCGAVLSFAIIGSTAPTTPTSKTASAAERKPAYTSSGGCKTDINGDMKCSHSSEMNLFGTTSQTTSEMKCGQNLVTLAYECKSESRAN